MTQTYAARHATWILDTIDRRGPLTRSELANELRFLRPRVLTGRPALRLICNAVRRLVNRGELEWAGTRNSTNVYAITDRGRLELEIRKLALAAIGREPADTIPIRYDLPNGDTDHG